jgi:hypothetical protein
MKAIIADYMTRGFVLTLRQLYYQLVARMIIENQQSPAVEPLSSSAFNAPLPIASAAPVQLIRQASPWR